MGGLPHNTAMTGSLEDRGLFSLVEAATISTQISPPLEGSVDSGLATGSLISGNSLGSSSVGNTSKVHSAMKHRRLSSTGQVRRRLSDAREATSRPSPAMLQTAAAALSSLANLSLAGAPPHGMPQTETSFASASGQLTTSIIRSPKVEIKDDIIPDDAAAPAKTEINGAGISVTKSGKKRGTIFKCESCSKVYRHPSCLIKHRWEHSPHWREASKFLLSKHQQVQLLEAAAILSHLAPSASGGTSLPEDRSLWPSFLSGGLLPPPDQANNVQDIKYSSKARASSVDQPIMCPTSSSVPAPSLSSTRISSASGPGSYSGTATGAGRSPSAGPRLHDYTVPSSCGLTQVRPGVVGVSTIFHLPQSGQSNATAMTPERSTPNSIHAYPPAAHRSAPVPVPTSKDAFREPSSANGAYSFVSGASVSDAWSSPVSVSFAQSSFRSSVDSPASDPASVSGFGIAHSFSDGAGGWSLPRSSVRSSSLSRSRSGSVDMDRISEADFVDVDHVVMSEDEESVDLGRFGGFISRGWKGQPAPTKIEEEWDGMEMEMEM